MQKDRGHKIDIYPQDRQFFDRNGLTKKLENLNLNFFITNGIQRFHYRCFRLNTGFSNSFFVSPPTSPQWIAADERFRQHRNRPNAYRSKWAYVYFNYSDFTSSYEPFSQALKSFDYVLQRENCLKKKDANKTTTEAVHPKCPPFLCRFSARTWCKFPYLTNSELTLGVKFIFIISLMHTLSDKVRFVQRKLKPEEAFRTKKWMVLAEHLLAQAHIHSFNTGNILYHWFFCQLIPLRLPHF